MITGPFKLGTPITSVEILTTPGQINVDMGSYHRNVNPYKSHAAIWRRGAFVNLARGLLATTK